MSKSEFQVDEFLETLLRMKPDQPRRYAQNISKATRMRVDQYVRAKDEQTHTDERRAA
jgi:hypothetical protein